MQIYGIKRIFFFVFFGGLKKKQYLCSVNAKIGICFYFYFFSNTIFTYIFLCNTICRNSGV